MNIQIRIGLSILKSPNSSSTLFLPPALTYCRNQGWCHKGRATRFGFYRMCRSFSQSKGMVQRTKSTKASSLAAFSEPTQPRA